MLGLQLIIIKADLYIEVVGMKVLTNIIAQSASEKQQEAS